ncbi:unnamed protein product [Rotaria sordida]|uniref:Uncharacterized protein n=1 Tax=Rotaria sordida TaxID=392033 RepID=A0A818HL04_9BILA|nr:unnamed protein product [Rotaria sordida]CAF3572909.1 unnamed protein product [Rotaria sordida]
MPFAIDKILLCLAVILLFALSIDIHAIDADYFVQLNHDPNSPESVRYMAKRRFLPTRRESNLYISDDDDDVNGPNKEDEFHLNAKRYFLKSKRYFLNSKRDIEQNYE